MKISKIKVTNFRLLKSLELDLEDDLSLVIGKNNCGKTSLLSVLDKFLGKRAGINPSFAYEDFNLDFQKELEEIYISEKFAEILSEFESEEDKKWKNMGLSLKLFIEYNESDSLANISKLMMDLDPENKIIVLLFEYGLDEDNFRKLKEDFFDYKLKKERERTEEPNEVEPAGEVSAETTIPDNKTKKRGTLFNEFMKRNSRRYFQSFRKSIAYNRETKLENDMEFIDIGVEKIALSPVINFNFIPARREISNKDSDKTLSSLASEYYRRKDDSEEDSPQIESFKDKLEETDIFLDGVYEGIFEKVLTKVHRFGGIVKGESIINIISTLQHRDLLTSNTTVIYDHDEESSLPENYNGLGYLNLISMIFDVELLISDFRRNNHINEEPADINLLFVEEPEAHTHPQMQYVFIKNIKDILKEASEGRDEAGARGFRLQTLITSHSSHITSESKFDDIKYFTKERRRNEVIARNLRDLEGVYGDGEAEHFKFLKQYLTLHRAELFFADKAIFIEGDTERILLPAMMKKIDQEDKARETDGTEQDNKTLPLLSQNISIIEVGAYSHIFEKFFDFIGLKSLVITDIDAEKQMVKMKEEKEVTTYEKCRVEDTDAKYTSNAALKYFFSSVLDSLDDSQKLDYFKSLSFDNKRLKKDCGCNQWVCCNEGHLAIVYQIKERNSNAEEYHARSFEDAFFHLNRQFVVDNKDGFHSLKNKHLFEERGTDSYELAEKCVHKKPSFAMEILLKSNIDDDGNEFSNWITPGYIKEGLSWLKRD